MKTSLIVILIILSIFSCKNYAPTTKEKPDCKHIISGNSVFKNTWLGRVPVMIINYHGSHEFLFGKLGEKTSEGYMFYPEKLHNFGYAPKDRLYEFSEIECLYDSSRNKIYGSIPEEFEAEWKMIWQILPYNYKKSSKKKPILLEIETNNEFGFCLDPGKYQVQKIEFIKTNKRNYIDVSDYLPEIIFEVDSNKNNYIGDIYLDETNEKLNLFDIPCKAVKRPFDSFGSASIFAVLNQISKSKMSPKHSIFIKDALSKDDKRTKSLLKIIKK